MSDIDRLWRALRRKDEGTGASGSDAEFLGWQETMDGGAIPLYVVLSKLHPLNRSTVSAKTLRQHNIEIPPTPDFNEQRRSFNNEE